MVRAIKEVKFRRRREGVTDYAKRLALVKSGLERVVVRKTNKRVLGQVIRYEEKGDKVIASAESGELAKKYGWPSRSNRPTAYLTGLLLARKSSGPASLPFLTLTRSLLSRMSTVDSRPWKFLRRRWFCTLCGSRPTQLTNSGRKMTWICPPLLRVPHALKTKLSIRIASASIVLFMPPRARSAPSSFRTARICWY